MKTEAPMWYPIEMAKGVLEWGNRLEDSELSLSERSASFLMMPLWLSLRGRRF